MLTFAQFLEIHPELANLGKDEQLTEYELYIESLTVNYEDWGSS